MGGRWESSAALVLAALLALTGVRLGWGERRGRGRRRTARLSVLLAVAAGGVAGAALGMRAGGTAATSCPARLRTGDGLIAAGELDSGLAVPRSESRWARGVLRDATLWHGGRVCRLPRLPVRVYRPGGLRPAGVRLRVVGEWRSFGDRPAGVRPLGAYGAVYGTGEADPDTAAGPRPDGGLGAFRQLRGRAARKLEALLPPDVVGEAKALALADRTTLSPQVTRRFADAGVAHLLAISGLHIGFLAVGATTAAALFLRGAGRYLLGALLTVTYVLLIGAPPAAVRAAVLFGGYAVTRMRGSPSSAGDLLGLAAVAMLVGDPLLLVHPGFQLSFAGFAGLIGGRAAGARVWDRLASRGRCRAGSAGAARRRLLRGLRQAGVGLAASGGAFLCTAPLVAVHFGRVAPVAVLSSLVGAPLVAAALAGLLPALLLPSPVARLFADGATVAIRALLRLADLFAELPLHASVGPPDAIAWVAIGAGLLGGARLAARRAARASGALLLGASLAVWLAAPVLRGFGWGRATLLCSLDVGQGDAMALRTRRGHWLLLDAGPGPGFGDKERAVSYDAGSRVVVPFLRSRGARAVDLFLLSHPHLDHLGGAAAVFRAFPVRRVADAGYPVPSGGYLAYLEEVQREGAVWRAARAGTRLRLDEVELLVLAPGPAGSAPSVDPNVVSVVVRARIDGAFTYLNTGDAPAETEAELVARWPADSLRAELLKVGHHGSRTSSTLAWLEAVSPRVAVVSVGGRNRYGHPDPTALARLDSAGVEVVWRTDREGTYCVEVEPGGAWRRVAG